MATETLGGLDVVADNAGHANSAPVEHMADNDFRAQVETNPFGVINVTRAAEAIVHTTTLDHPPPRLPLGSDALRSAAQSSASRADEADTLAEISRSTDHT